ncbi:ABC transporter ATP-binding protein [Halorubrum aethiopicum]|uniref:ABC transporter ATP-binding protein n=1 Tax=Halorubrum aethiopicum TaxID=1758255 RepID=UPI00082E441E|nr:ABC transporter ATP-binding protein [Halorubrum aethiopicum]
MANINITDLTKVYESDAGDVVAVNDVDLDITDGEFLVLVGPSGCGKTTTLRCLAGLESATKGSIRFAQRDVTDLRARDRDVAMVFQNYALYPHMTVRQNMEFGLRLSTEQPAAKIGENVESTAQMLGIEDQLDEKPRSLSGGQQQRVALGRAIVREPSVFLMDEPLSNLDAKLRAQMRTELQELQQQLDVTTIYVTHDQTEAMAMGDRIAVLDGGELQQVGEPETVYVEPANEFVAKFIGSPSINLFTASVDGKTLSATDAPISYQLTDHSMLGERDQVRVGIRPEDLRVVSDGVFTATVNVAEHMGNENFLYLDANGTEVTARIESSVRPEAGSEVDLMFEEDSLYLFDEQTGDAIKTKEAVLEDNSLPFAES